MDMQKINNEVTSMREKEYPFFEVLNVPWENELNRKRDIHKVHIGGIPCYLPIVTLRAGTHSLDNLASLLIPLEKQIFVGLLHKVDTEDYRFLFYSFGSGWVRAVDEGPYFMFEHRIAQVRLPEDWPQSVETPMVIESTRDNQLYSTRLLTVAYV